MFIDQGAKFVATNVGVGEAFSDIITGIFFFLVIGCEFFINYKIKFRQRKKTTVENTAEEAGCIMILSFLQSAIRFSTAFLFGSVGETVTEKSGNLNLGIPGIMCMGASGSLIGASLYVSAVGGASGIEAWGATIVTLLFALIFSLIGGLIYCVLTTSLRCNQNVSGLALTHFRNRTPQFLRRQGGNDRFYDDKRIFSVSRSPSSNRIGSRRSSCPTAPLVYIAIILAVIAAVVIKKTRVGLNLRAVGENPATADAGGHLRHQL